MTLEVNGAGIGIGSTFEIAGQGILVLDKDGRLFDTLK